MSDVPIRRRGDSNPPLDITISDTRATADFSTLGPTDVKVMVELAGEVIVNDFIDNITPAQDGKSARVVRNWEATDLDTAGRHWVTVYVVPWDQSFPDDGPLRLDVTRAPGDV